MSPPSVAAGPAPPDGRLWTFATGLYDRDGVAAACLALQDDHGADVPLLLFAAWTATQGLTVSASRMTAAARTVSAWRGEVIEPLRALRRRLTHGPAPAPDGPTDMLREDIRRAELAAERIGIAALESAASSWPAGDKPGDALADVTGALTLCFETQVGRPPDETAGALLRVLAGRAA